MRRSAMQTIKFVYWQEEGIWLGYLQEYPDCWTQGKTLEDLQEHLKDLHRDLTSGGALASPVPAGKDEEPCPVPGRGKGKLTVISEDDDHLKDFAEYMP
jgi:hypothetical protein